VYELEEGTVPHEVAINEAVVLAKRYASEDAARLVNGILGRIAREEEAVSNALFGCVRGGTVSRRPLLVENVGNLPVPHTPPRSSTGHQSMSSVDEALAKAEELLARLNERREELERLAGADDVDGEAAVDVIAELAELARQIEVELTRARTLADAPAEERAMPSGRIGR
jgi:hypothetical protein